MIAITSWWIAPELSRSLARNKEEVGDAVWRKCDRPAFLSLPLLHERGPQSSVSTSLPKCAAASMRASTSRAWVQGKLSTTGRS